MLVKKMKIETYKHPDEQILWTGKPKKIVYIKEAILRPFLFVSLIWAAVSFGMFFGFFLGNNLEIPIYFLVPYCIIHLAPFWFYLIHVITSLIAWKHIEFMVTDKAVYTSYGVLRLYFDRKTFQEVTNVSVRQGIIDRHHNVGDVFIIAGRSSINFIDIEDYMKVYQLVAKTSQDIFADTMYPNDLRPKENHGYQTQYKPEDKK